MTTLTLKKLDSKIVAKLNASGMTIVKTVFTNGVVVVYMK